MLAPLNCAAILRRRSQFQGPQVLTKIITSISFSLLLTGPLLAAPCGNTAAGFEDWKGVMASEAKAAGVGKAGIAALNGASYSKATISADRNQKSFKYTLDKFLKVRGADTIVAQGRARKAKNAKLFASIEAQYGVPAGVLLAIHGMETGFGGFMGDTNIVSAVSTLVWDCRRSDYFKPHLIAALEMVDRGSISASTVGAKHGEWGHTQFLMGNALTYGVDGNGDGRVDLTNTADAMATTANYLRQKGWQPGKGYQEGEPNFAAIKEWNAATVYQQAIALMAAKIDK
jgi:membrane-bound lytic murein transglycosylase B